MAYPEFKLVKIPWYIRFCLWFCKMQFSGDWASDGSPVGNGVFWKSFRGKIYIMDME